MYNYFYLFLFLLYFQLLQNNTKNNKIMTINKKNFDELYTIITNNVDEFEYNSLSIINLSKDIILVEVDECKRVFNSEDRIEILNFIINKE